MLKIKRISTLCFLILVTLTVQAEIKLPSIFGNNMVLQQRTNARIWGIATPEKKVTLQVGWSDKIYETQSDKRGNWKIEIPTIEAGGPYEIIISDGSELKLENVLLGEVWVCSGQSNMEMPMAGYQNQPVNGANEAIARVRSKNLRLFTVEKTKTLEPQFDFNGEWKTSTPASVSMFSATAYYFGEMLQEVLQVPVGLVCSAWGGTRIEPWISESGHERLQMVELPDKNKTDFTQYAPTALYNGMIHPMAGVAMRGVIWYQGESNRSEPKEYLKFMSGLIVDWRTNWGIGDFPFYYVQIAPFGYNNGLSSAYLREAQLKAENTLPNIGMACLMDVGEEKCIHPAAKDLSGKRLAYLALAKTYGEEAIQCSGPVLKNMVIEDSLIYLTFDQAKRGLTSYGKELSHFTVSGDDKKFHPAKAIITKEGITLYSPVKNPVAVRYAFDDFVIGDLFNVSGLPASSFRTDDWEIEK